MLSACSELVGDEPLAVTRLNGPAQAAKLLPIEGRLRAAHILVGKENSAYAALVSPEPDPMDDLIIGKIQVVALHPPYAVTEVPERAVAFPPSPAKGFCTAQLAVGDAFNLPRYSLHRPGEPEDGPYTALTEPTDKLKLLCGERTLVAFGNRRDNQGIDLLRRHSDGTVSHLLLPWPLDADPAWDQGPFGFDASERVLFILGGDIITKIGDVKISDLNDFYLALLPMRSGQKVEVEVNRKGETKRFTVQLIERTAQHVGALVR